jgi:WD40 repeat protein
MDDTDRVSKSPYDVIALGIDFPSFRSIHTDNDGTHEYETKSHGLSRYHFPRGLTESFSSLPADSPPAPPLIASVSSYVTPQSFYWNDNFQATMDAIIQATRAEDLSDLKDTIDISGKLQDQNSRVLFSRLESLAKDFVFVSTLYGKIIIAERFLPEEQRTIKPVTKELKGIAGGNKFIVEGILFKFADDHLGLYGGVENAMKASSLDLLGCTAVLRSPVPELHVPLMCKIDYRGFRLTAMSLLPLNGSQSLVYGSDDGCKTVRNIDSEFDDCMRKLAGFLNLKQHRVHGVDLWTAADVEGHRSLVDHRMYLIDFSRLFPPEAPSAKSPPNSHLYRMLRPELVSRLKFPVSSDAFSRMGADRRLEHNNEIIEATATLVFYEIPKFAFWLCTQERYDPDLYPGHPEHQVGSLLHSFGINVRHLFKVFRIFHLFVGNINPCTRTETRFVELINASTTTFSSSTLAFKTKVISWTNVFLTEMVARTIKDIVRADLRDCMKKLVYPADEAFRKVVLKHLNRFLLRLPVGKHYQKFEARTKTLEQSYLRLREEWTNLSRHLVQKFEVPLDGADSEFAALENSLFLKILSADYLYRNIDRRRLYIRLKQALGLVFTPEVDVERNQNDIAYQYPLDTVDLVQVREIVKDMSIVSYATGKLLHLRGKAEVKERSIRLLNLALIEFQKTLPDLRSSWMYRELAQVQIDLGIRSVAPVRCKGLLDQALRTLQGIDLVTLDSGKSSLFLSSIETAEDIWSAEARFRRHVKTARNWCKYRLRSIPYPNGIPLDVNFGFCKLIIEKGSRKVPKSDWKKRISLLVAATTSAGEIRYFQVFPTLDICQALLDIDHSDENPFVSVPVFENEFVHSEQLHKAAVNSFMFIKDRFIISVGDAIDNTIVLFDSWKRTILYRQDAKTPGLDARPCDAVPAEGQCVLSFDLLLIFDTKGSLDHSSSSSMDSSAFQNSLMVCGGSDCSVVVRQLNDGVIRHCFWGHKAPVKKVLILNLFPESHSSEDNVELDLTPINFGKDPGENTGGRVCALTASDDHTVKIWLLESFIDQVRKKPSKRPLSLSKMPSLRKVKPSLEKTEVMSSESAPGCLLTLGNFFNENPHVGHTGSVQALAYSTDFLITGSDDKTIRLWRIWGVRLPSEEKKDDSSPRFSMRWFGVCTHILEGHCDSVLGLQVSFFRNVIFSHSADGSVRIWMIPEKFGLRSCVPTFDSDSLVESCLKRDKARFSASFCLRVLEAHMEEVISMSLHELSESQSPKTGLHLRRPAFFGKTKVVEPHLPQDRLLLVTGSTDNTLVIWCL